MKYRKMEHKLCFLLTALFLVQLRLSSACRSVQAISPNLGTLNFEMMPKVPEDSEDYYYSGRQFYKAHRPDERNKEGVIVQRKQPTMYLYHVCVDETMGLGRWVIGTEFGSKTAAVAYINSWAVTPYTTEAVNDNADSQDSRWYLQKPRLGGEDEGENSPSVFAPDASVTVQCVLPKSSATKDAKISAHSSDSDVRPGVGDNTLYFDSSLKYQPELTGFYVETAHSNALENGVRAVYAHIRRKPEDPILYMFKLREDTWMVGETPHEDSGLAFVDGALHASTPGQISSHHWRYVAHDVQNANGFTWNWDHGVVVSRHMAYSSDGSTDDPSEGLRSEFKTFENIYASLRYYRSIKFIPTGQEYITAHNGMPVPTLGLGTGGIYLEDLPQVLRRAIQIGYRSFDLAREYNNEELVASIVTEIENEAEALALREGRRHSDIRRQDMFYTTKVWPTQLGIAPTRDAVHESLRALRTNYLDAYLLHWPSCDPAVEWMHCSDRVDKNGTWQQSWRALEREYAEGRVMTIGVSNFDMNLLQELSQLAHTKPHFVQNHAELGDPAATDRDVRVWCRKRGVIYTPYAHQRNLQYLPQHLQESLEQVADMLGRSKHSVASRFFIQSGASIIPRTSDLQHLEENADVFSFSIPHGDMLELGWDEHHIIRATRDEL